MFLSFRFEKLYKENRLYTLVCTLAFSKTFVIFRSFLFGVRKRKTAVTPHKHWGYGDLSLVEVKRWIVSQHTYRVFCFPFMRST